MRSVPGVGSTFTITLSLPLSQHQPPQQQQLLLPPLARVASSPTAPHTTTPSMGLSEPDHNNNSSQFLSPTQPQPHPEKLRVLIVDDNTLNQLVAMKMLEQLGVRDLTKTGDGEEALEKLTTQRYDLVLMDCKLRVHVLMLRVRVRVE